MSNWFISNWPPDGKLLSNFQGSKRVFLVGNGKIALVRASVVVTYYIKLFRTGPDRHNGILMSLLFLVAKTKTFLKKYSFRAIGPSWEKNDVLSSVITVYLL